MQIAFDLRYGTESCASAKSADKAHCNATLPHRPRDLARRRSFLFIFGRRGQTSCNLAISDLNNRFLIWPITPWIQLNKSRRTNVNIGTARTGIVRD